mmetsp:Transcript_34169/g.45175  ORF Transcript_34169/g.45175 Transcript_34169/m.45175 type:complete len:248 (-) Transcript_34169:137-880(-)
MSSVFVGFTAGGLHALTGPDHLAALIPSCIGQHWTVAGLVGARWGLGHGLGAVMFGFLGFLVKGFFDVSALSSLMETAVGFSLVFIGMLGFREAFVWKNQAQVLPSYEFPKDDESKLAKRMKADHQPRLNSTATISMGILHGFTGTGHLVGVMPALTMPSAVTASLYLGGFCFGTLVAIAGFTSIIGEASVKLSSSKGSSQRVQSKILSFLSFLSSSFAIILGTIWIIQSLVLQDPNNQIEHQLHGT